MTIQSITTLILEIVDGTHKPHHIESKQSIFNPSHRHHRGWVGARGGGGCCTVEILFIYDPKLSGEYQIWNLRTPIESKEQEER